MSTKKFNAKRICHLLSQVWFYSFTLAIICISCFNLTVSPKANLAVILPTVFEEYWFFTAYFVLILISPFINILAQNLERATFLRMLLTLIVLWAIIPTFTTRDMYGTEIPQFVLLYLIGAYFQKHPENFFAKKKNRLLLTAACLTLLFLSTVFINLVAFIFPALAKFEYLGNYFYARSSILIVGSACGMFAMAVYHRPFSNTAVNTVSACAFGVYLIHDNPFVRKLLWTKIFNVAALYESPLFFAYALGISAIVFVCCAIIELVRQKTIARPLGDLLYKFAQSICRLFQKCKQAIFSASQDRD